MEPEARRFGPLQHEGPCLAVGAQDGLLGSLRGCLASLLSAEAGPYTHP
jgi:hypothetical protein